MTAGLLFGLCWADLDSVCLILLHEKLSLYQKKMPLAEKVIELTIWLTSSQTFFKEIANLF